MRLAIAGDASDVELAGLEGSFPWGEVAAGEIDGADLVVVLARGGSSCAMTVRSPAQSSGGERLISTHAADAWRREPWPVNDEMFGCSPGGPDGAVLVTGGEEAARRLLVQKLETTGLETVEADRITRDLVTESAVVIALGLANAPLAADALAVLAARRVLVTGPRRPCFGLRAGFDHLEATTADEAVVYAAAALKHWRAFARMRAFGAMAARRQIASAFYERLVTDIGIEQDVRV